MTTVTLDKEQYDDLIRYKNAYVKDEVVVYFLGSIYNYSYFKIQTATKQEAIELLTEKCNNLHEEIERLRNRSLIQRIFNK
jgi:hypothetical protein